MSTRNDTTTTINASTVAGGNALDETLVTQADGTTQAHRARVVMGLDDGRLVGLEADLPTEDNETRMLLRRIADSLDEIALLLHSAVS